MKTNETLKSDEKPLTRVEELQEACKKFNKAARTSPEFQKKMDQMFSEPLIIVQTTLKNMPTEAMNREANQSDV